jgi:hypothetical protein
LTQLETLEVIEIGQGDAPKLTFRLYEKLPDGTTAPYVLTGATVQMIGKTNRDDSDGSAVFTYAGTVVDDGAGVGDEYSVVSFQVLAIHTVDVRTLFTKVVATKGGNPDTVKKFWFAVVNT